MKAMRPMVAHYDSEYTPRAEDPAIIRYWLEMGISRTVIETIAVKVMNEVFEEDPLPYIFVDGTRVHVRTARGRAPTAADIKVIREYMRALAADRDAAFADMPPGYERKTYGTASFVLTDKDRP